MNFRAKLIVGVTVALFSAGLTLLEPAQPALATPGLGTDCLKCHSAMPPTKANVKASKPSAEAKANTTQPAAKAPVAPKTQPVAKTQPAAGSSSKLTANMVGKNVAVTASLLNVRASGSVKAKIIATVKKNEVLTVLQVKLGWLQINFKGTTGWVYGKYVILIAKPPAATPAKPKPAPTATKPATPVIPVAPARPALFKVPSINDQAQNSHLGSMHWNMFRDNVNNPEDPEQNNCITCHSAVKIVDDPQAQLTDFLKKGQKYAIGESTNPATGVTEFEYSTATADGKYVDNNFEGITCRVCHITDKNGVTLRRPDNTCTLCHGRTFNWERGSGSHVEQDFFQGHGETSWDPSVHYTLGMQCQSCHTMNSVKHDYEPAKAEDIVRDAKCQPCHQNARDLENMIQATHTKVADSLAKLGIRVQQAEKLVADGKATDTQKLIAKAKARSKFVTGDKSNGVHNPQFAAELINEANKFLDDFNGMMAKATPALDLGNLMVFSQAQSSKLGNAHWDMLETNIFNAEDPEQNNCISCHSAVKMVDDPQAQLVDFLKTGTKYATGEISNPAPGQDPYIYSTATNDGKYLKNYFEGITCRVCHTFNQVGYINLRRNDEQTCGLCHGRTYNWNTGSGHHIELAFFKGQGSVEKGIADMPSPKATMKFSCQDCHFMDNTKHDFEPATPAQIAASPQCKGCHTASNVEGYIKGIQEEVSASIAKLEPRLNAAKAYVDKNPNDAAAKEIYTQAKAGITFVEDDFSDGVHNPPFARSLLSRSDKLLTDFAAKYK